MKFSAMTADQSVGSKSSVSVDSQGKWNIQEVNKHWSQGEGNTREGCKLRKTRGSWAMVKRLTVRSSSEQPAGPMGEKHRHVCRTKTTTVHVGSLQNRY